MTKNRSCAVARMLCAACVAIAPVLAQALETPPAPENPRSHKWVEVAPGVHAFISPPGVTPIVSGNSLVIVGDDGVAVVDSGQFPSLARAEIEAIRRITPKPVRFLVNTHWHPDHWLGNAEFKAAYPGIAIIATQNTRTLAEAKGFGSTTPAYAKDTLAFVEKLLADAASGKAPPLSDVQRAYFEFAVPQFRRLGAEVADVQRVLPDVVFRDGLDLHLGKRVVEVRFAGRGNTGGDAIVYVPDAKVLATGDLLVSPFPYGAGSFYSEWIVTLKKLAAMDAAVIVPGHGEVQSDKRYLERVIALLESAVRQVGTEARNGATLDEVRRKVRLQDEETAFCGADAWCRHGFRGNFANYAVERIYREAKEGPLTGEDGAGG